ncbi:MAG TPA: hypothetical protein VF945_15680 [Polyangia bacterium]
MRAVLACALLSVAASGGELSPVASDALCVTRGRVAATHSQLAVDEPKLRAVVPASDGNRAELRLVYRGPTAETALLGSGALRRQIGIKLRAQDGCNLLYVMWRIEPASGIVVSVKRNPGARTHAECGNRGYRNLRGTTLPVAPLVAGRPRRLAAAIDGRVLTVTVDGAPAWRGELDGESASLAGPAGVRSDNVRADFELRVASGGGARAMSCGGSVEDE